MTNQLADPLWWCLLDLLHARAADELRVAALRGPTCSAGVVCDELLERVKQLAHT
jgi:hypothetical protein